MKRCHAKDHRTLRYFPILSSPPPRPVAHHISQPSPRTVAHHSRQPKETYYLFLIYILKKCIAVARE